MEGGGLPRWKIAFLLEGGARFFSLKKGDNDNLLLVLCIELVWILFELLQLQEKQVNKQVKIEKSEDRLRIVLRVGGRFRLEERKCEYCGKRGTYFP